MWRAHLGVSLKGYAMLDELLPFIRRPFELANLCQLGTNISDGVDCTRAQSFDVLNELQKLDQQGLLQKIPPTYHAKFVDTDKGCIFEALGADKEQKKCLSMPSVTNSMLNSLACLLCQSGDM